MVEWNLPFEPQTVFASAKRIISHKGKDIYEVQWSTEVTMSKELKKPVLQDIVHVELSCQPIS